MPSIDDLYPSKYLSASDLQGREFTLVIARIAREEISNEMKNILHFERAKKPMVLNVTNARRIAHYYGKRTEDWIGKPVILGVELVDFQGQTKEAIRVKGVPPGGLPSMAPAANQAQGYGQAKQQPQFERVEKEGYDSLELDRARSNRAADDPDDEIPF